MMCNLTSTLRQHPQYQEGKRQILQAFREVQHALDGVRPAQPENKLQMQHALDQLEKERGVPLYYPYIGSGLGKGALVQLIDGSVKYDLISGIGAHYFGHSSQEIIEVALDAAMNDIVMQ